LKTNHLATLAHRVVRWYICVRKYQFWYTYFVRSRNGKFLCILRLLVYFSHFGMLYPEKYGNPAVRSCRIVKLFTSINRRKKFRTQVRRAIDWSAPRLKRATKFENLQSKMFPRQSQYTFQSFTANLHLALMHVILASQLRICM
jgi:hypothetical protein